MRTDRQTDTTKVIAVFRNFAIAPKNYYNRFTKQLYGMSHSYHLLKNVIFSHVWKLDFGAFQTTRVFKFLHCDFQA